MGIKRRGFLKLLGVTGMTLAFGENVGAKPDNDVKDVEFNGILYDATRCKGCRGCEFDCAEAHNLPEPKPTKEIAAIRKTDETCNTVVNTYKTEKGEVHIKRQCMHCNEPACAAACLTKAMCKTKTGPVTWN